jgi:hypothetical protein
MLTMNYSEAIVQAHWKLFAVDCCIAIVEETPPIQNCCVNITSNAPTDNLLFHKESDQ